MSWLKKIRSKKFLRYIYYRLYNLGLKTGITTPPLSVAITMAFTHLLQLIFLISLVSLFLNKSDFVFALFTGNHIILIVFFAFGFLYLTEKIYQYKDRHLEYIQEFKEETVKQKKLGVFHLFVYF